LPSAVLVYTNRLRNATTYLYFEETIRQARAGAQIVVWPEHAAPVAKEDEPALVARAQEVARQEGIYLFNGDGILRTAATPYGVLSGVICWDTDFPSTVLQAGRNGTDILLSPSLDFREIDPIHAHMAIVRAIENGVSVVRVSDNGLSVVADPYGRILAATDHFTAGKRNIVAQVPTQGVQTLYPIIGDLFGWLAVVGFVIIAAWAVIQGRRAARAETSESEGQVPS
jgi:apolipoprotein N-acyltransferase